LSVMQVITTGGSRVHCCYYSRLHLALYLASYKELHVGLFWNEVQHRGIWPQFCMQLRETKHSAACMLLHWDSCVQVIISTKSTGTSYFPVLVREKRMVQEPSSCRWMATSVDRLTIDSDDTHVVVVLTMLSARQTKIAMTTLTAGGTLKPA
jgi:hypothetical protein